ncbi:MAG: pantoate--beta-alanine ligase, partial [Actinomycetota bacterium]|nr:pantoate--beta-alanine ligase [Actinomycetota bacterium]
AGPDAVRAAATAVLAAEPALAVEYLALVDRAGLDEVGSIYSGPALLAVAARLGATRLIDNATVTFPGS